MVLKSTLFYTMKKYPSRRNCLKDYLKLIESGFVMVESP